MHDPKKDAVPKSVQKGLGRLARKKQPKPSRGGARKAADVAITEVKGPKRAPLASNPSQKLDPVALAMMHLKKTREAIQAR